MADIYGTLGPKCLDADILAQMLKCGMTGIRLNLSHTTIRDAAPWLALLKKASEQTGIVPKLLVDMQGPELRTGVVEQEILLQEGTVCRLGKGGIAIPEIALQALKQGQEVLIDDGKLLLQVTDGNPEEGFNAAVLRGGILKSRKSLALPGAEVYPPAITDEDRQNIRDAASVGVYGVMQPFVRNREDLCELREALNESGAGDIKIFAKIENQDGVRNLKDYMELADEIIIARGDLGNSMPLWELPRVQKEISAICREAGKPFMVVTQMLASMEKNAVPTRAEVSDIFNAIVDGANSVMITGETAAGDYPVEAVRYLVNTVREAERYCR